LAFLTRMLEAGYLVAAGPLTDERRTVLRTDTSRVPRRGWRR
jgi:hypothetical protein